MQNVTLHKGALRHPSFGVCMCAPGTVLQENSNTSEIFWELLKFVSAATCLGLAMDGPLRVQLHSWPGWPWVWIHWWNCGFTQSIRIERRQRRQRKKTKRRGQKMITFHLKSLAKKCLKFWNDAYAETLIVLHLSFFLHFGSDKLSFQHQSTCVQNFVIMINFWWRRGKLWWTFPFVILCDSLWFFVILCAFSILFSTLCEMRREGVLWTSLWGREGDFCSRVERCEPRDRCGLLRSLPEAVAIPPPGRRRQQWRQEFLWSLEDQACYIGISKTH